MPPATRRHALALAGCLAFAALLAFPELDARPLFSPAEVRYALVGREMHESGDWIQPRLNHVRYYEKPPLLYWSLAASFGAFGADDFAARVPGALAYVGTVGITFLIGAELLGIAGAVMAALVQATAVGPFLFGRFVFTDGLFGFALSLSLLGLTRLAGDGGRGAAILLHLGVALAGLSKGLAGIVFPYGVAAAVWALRREPGFGRRLRPWTAAMILAGVWLPWHLALAMRDPSFVWFYVVNEHVLRFMNLRVPIDYYPLTIPKFWLATLLWMAPWSLFLPAALGYVLRAGRREAMVVPLVWAAWILAFFTASTSRLEYYALPAFPALAVIVAAWWRDLGDDGRLRPGLWLPQIFLLTVGGILGALLLGGGGNASRWLTALVSNLDGYYREYFVEHPGTSFAFVSGAIALAKIFAVVLVLVAAGGCLATWARRFRLAFAIWACGIAPILILVDRGHRLVAPDRSQRDLARIVLDRWQEGSRLVTRGDYEDRCGVTWYTKLPTEMVDGAGADLLFGYGQGDAAGLFLEAEAFHELWSSADRVFLLTDRSSQIPGAVVLGESVRQLLLVNSPATPGPHPGR